MTSRRPPARSRGRRRDGGQAAVELALALPLVVVLALGIVQVVVVAGRQAAIERLARDGARAASVSADAAGSARAAVERATGLRPIEVETTGDATSVTVVVGYLDRTNVPIIGALIGDVELSGRATMPREPP